MAICQLVLAVMEETQCMQRSRCFLQVAVDFDSLVERLTVCHGFLAGRIWQLWYAAVRILPGYLVHVLFGSLLGVLLFCWWEEAS